MKFFCILLLITTSLHAQYPNQTTEAARTISKGFKKIFGKKDQVISLPDSIVLDLSGHWKGKYEGVTTQEFTLQRHTLRYEYDMYIYKFANNKYGGYAESRGDVPINTITLRQKDLGHFMQAYVFLEFPDSQKRANIEITEKYYINTVNEPAWPLKEFTSAIVSGNPNMKMVGKSTTRGYSGFELTLKKVADTIDKEHAAVIEDIFMPRFEIRDVKFTSNKNESFLDYMGKGQLDFTVVNIGKAATSSLSLEGTPRRDDPIELSAVYGPADAGIVTGEGKQFTLSITATDRILTNKVVVSVRVALKGQSNTLQSFSQDINIDVRQ